MASEIRSVSELLSQALGQVSTLIRSEINLARAEIAAKISRAVMGIAMLAGSLAVMIATLVLLLMTIAVALVAAGLSEPLAYLIATVIGGVGAGALAYIGLNRLKADELMPKRTMHQLQRDAVAAKEQVS